MLQSPLDVSQAMQSRLLPADQAGKVGDDKSWIFTSATLEVRITCAPVGRKPILMSPIFSASRRKFDTLCKVARETRLPLTVTGSSAATGVSTPVRPT